MTSAFEIGLEEGTDDIQCFGYGDEVRRQREHISIIMLAREFREFGLPAERGTDTLVLVGSHGDTVSGGTDDNAELIFAFLYRLSERMGEIGIVATLGRVAAEVFHFSTVILEEQLYLLF